MNILTVIPARSGSKGLKDKNIKLLNGKPLVFYSVESALEIFDKEDVFLSTDSKKYKELVSEHFDIQIPFLRPEHLSSDTSSTQEVLLHVIEYFETIGKRYDAILLLQPTSPFREKKHIIEAIELFKKNSVCEMLVSVCQTKSNPYYVLYEENEYGYLKKVKESRFTRRQDIPKVYEINGSIYVFNVKSLIEKKVSKFENIMKYEMNHLYSVDIDDQLDFDFASFLIKQNRV